ncbi:MAG: nicotinate (nicotinamide) nucleotide adenylyltransferase [Muribaculaceae bacterium]|nr:nicotinate (nicotinamide) nucleotide adenylyltransferase [Muribaculaceae bacterium]MDE7190268.1 nicotinate (nicotinamide) nucleotide adenylyltransferase [Muribaculaceae bacterium]
MTDKMPTAVYSGTFDPPHIGHAIVANYIAQWAGVEEVLMMVSPLNPLKAGTHPVDDNMRMHMVEALAAGCRGVKASDFELHLPLPTYSYRTLCALREAYPGRQFRLVIGSDNWSVIDRWRNPEEIIREFGLIVYPRPGHLRPAVLPDNVQWLDDAPQVVMSSTFVRQAAYEGRRLDYFVPHGVVELIEKYKLYRNNDK